MAPQEGLMSIFANNANALQVDRMCTANTLHCSNCRLVWGWHCQARAAKIRASQCCRVFAFTRLNAHSSRSHAIVMLTIIKRHRTAPGQEEGPLQRVKIGKLFMVDLAGSERLKKSLSTGEPMKNDRISIVNNRACCINPLCSNQRSTSAWNDYALQKLDIKQNIAGKSSSSALCCQRVSQHRGALTTSLLVAASHNSGTAMPEHHQCSDWQPGKLYTRADTLCTRLQPCRKEMVAITANAY